MAELNNGADREMTRVEAAAFLTDLGHKMSPQRLATRATEGLGPTYERNGRGHGVVYRESVLRAWVESPDSNRKGGRGNKAPKKVKVPKDAGEASPTDLRTVLKAHIELADKLIDGSADAMAGFRFARSIEVLRRLVS